jgi:thioredoxin reductase
VSRAVRIDEVDLLVVGAGPAGLAAAAEAARCGARAAVADEAPAAGGCLRFQFEPGGAGERGRTGADQAARLAREAADAGVRTVCGATVWGLFPEWEAYVSPVDPAAGGDLPDVVRSRAAVVATGAFQKPVGIPGWSLPGVLNPGAVLSLVNVHRVLPGRRAAVVGTELLALHAAAGLALAGAEVLGVLAPLPGPYVPDCGFAPAVERAAARWGIALVRGRAAAAITGEGRVRGVAVAATDGGASAGAEEEHWDVDLVVLSGGLCPLVNLLAAAGCPLVYIPELGGHVPLCGPDLETPLAGVFAAGSVCGAVGAEAAEAHGRLAGLAAARRLGLIDEAAAGRRLRQAHERCAAADAAAPPFAPDLAAGRRRLAECWRAAPGARARR